MNRLQAHERIICQLGTTLEVRLQTPEASNVAAKLGENQVAVTDPNGRVRAFCGPASHPETLPDATLFAAAPVLYEALTLAQEALEDANDAELVADALRLAKYALAQAHAHTGSELN